VRRKLGKIHKIAFYNPKGKKAEANEKARGGSWEQKLRETGI